MSQKLLDYELLYEFFPDKNQLSAFMVMFNGLTMKIKLHDHKRCIAQQLLIKGDRPSDIARALDMRANTVAKIKERMIKDNLVLYANEGMLNETT